MQTHNDKLIWSRLNEGNYTGEETVLLKLPLALPYPTYSAGYQPMQEEFEYKGTYYKGVQQKIEGDTLYILCVKDAKKSNLSQTLTKYAKEVNDLPTQSKGKASLTKLLKEYETQHEQEIIKQHGWCSVNHYLNPSSQFLSWTRCVLSPPPKF